jgi:aspartyl-tRNA synthetase
MPQPVIWSFLSPIKPGCVAASLGHLRTDLARQLKLYREDDYRFVWITDFPLLEYDEEENRYVAMHHPFTSPVDEDMNRLETDPEPFAQKLMTLS